MGAAGELDARVRWITVRREEAERHVVRKRRFNSRIIITSLLASTAATALAGFAAAAGAAPVASWRITCGIVALLTSMAALLTGMQRQLDLPSDLLKLSTCLGRLKALEYAASMGIRSAEQIDAECQDLIAEYPEYMR